MYIQIQKNLGNTLARVDEHPYNTLVKMTAKTFITRFRKLKCQKHCSISEIKLKFYVRKDRAFCKTNDSVYVNQSSVVGFFTVLLCYKNSATLFKPYPGKF